MKLWRKYQSDIISGRINASEYLVKLCKKLEHEYTEKQHSDSFEYRFDPTVIPKITTIVAELTHVRGDLAGQPIELEPWQVWFFSQLYGWKRKDNGIRRFKFAYLFTGKGNGKTIIDSIVLALDLLFNNGGEAIVVAARQEQSDIAFQNVKSFIMNSETLAGQLKSTTKSIYNPNRGNTCKALSGRPEGINGKNLSVAVIDEIAEIKNFEVYNNTLSSCSKRLESLVLMSTTAQPTTTSIGYQEWRKCQKILDGTISDETYLPVLYQLDIDDSWEDPSCYIKANPNLDVSIRLEELDRKRKNAIAGITSDEVQLRTLHLNQWIFDRSDMWIGPERWQAISENFNTYEDNISEEVLSKSICCGGIDLSLRNDLSVVTLCFWIEDIKKYYFQHLIYVPEEELQSKMQADTYLFYEWIKAGWVRAIPGPVIRNDVICNDILEMNKRYNISEMVFDKQYMDDESKLLLSKNLLLLEMPQKTETMSQPTSNFYNQAMLGSLIDPNPVMAWCISNVEIERNAMGIKVRKEYPSSNRRVDPVITSIMSLQRVSTCIKIHTRKKGSSKDWSKLKY